jgi:hypothetical protein
VSKSLIDIVGVFHLSFFLAVTVQERIKAKKIDPAFEKNMMKFMDRKKKSEKKDTFSQGEKDLYQAVDRLNTMTRKAEEKRLGAVSLIQFKFRLRPLSQRTHPLPTEYSSMLRNLGIILKKL